VNDKLTIHIPFDLARHAVWQRKLVTKYETNQVIKSLDTWLVLKAETKSSWLQNWNRQKQHLFAICKVSESIFRHRLKLLQDMHLVTFDRHSIRLCSWDELGKEFSIKIDNKLSIEYDLQSKQRVQDWIIATEIKDNQNRQSFAIVKKVNENPDCSKAVIAAMVKAGANKDDLSDMDCFLSWFKALYLSDFVRVSDIHELMMKIRPDTNRGVKGIAGAWNCKRPITITYWKRVLQKSKIVHIDKLQVQSENRARNAACRVLWLKEAKQTLLCLCDQITVLMPWTIINPLVETIETIKTLQVKDVSTC
jgi:hypothetical protein